MKRFMCTVADKRGFRGKCMTDDEKGEYVLFECHKKISQQWRSQLDHKQHQFNDASRRINELESALRSTNDELLSLINECNEYRQRDIRCDQLDPPELHDYQTRHDNAVLRGDVAMKTVYGQPVKLGDTAND